MTVFETADAELLPDFQRRVVSVGGKAILTARAGDGPPLLMLHGDPQTHLCWHLIAPRLIDQFTVVLTDLRGRGESHKPGASPRGAAYAKREMAAEQRRVMEVLGYDKFAVVGHDRGARVARRLAMDFPEVVTKLVVMDVVPALNFYEAFNAEIAQDYFYFSFLTQPPPLPESLILGGPGAFMRQILFGLSDRSLLYDPRALDAYMASSTQPDSVVAMCECFRAGYHLDRLHDLDNRKDGVKIICPTLVMWGENGVVGRRFNVREIWSDWCAEPLFAPMQSGHFIPEEAPDEAYNRLVGFLS